MELYQIGQMMNKAKQREDPLAGGLTTALTNFMGGVEKAKTEDEKQLDKVLKFMEFQKRLQEAKDYEARRQQMETQMRGKSLDVISSGARDRTPPGKFMEMLNFETPVGRKMKAMFDSVKEYKPFMPSDKFQTTTMWGQGGPRLEYKETGLTEKEKIDIGTKTQKTKSESAQKWVNEQKKRLIDEMKEIQDNLRYGVGGKEEQSNIYLIKQRQLNDLNKWIPGDPLPRIKEYEVEDVVTQPGWLGIGRKKEKMLRRKGDTPYEGSTGRGIRYRRIK